MCKYLLMFQFFISYINIYWICRVQKFLSLRNLLNVIMKLVEPLAFIIQSVLLLKQAHLIYLSKVEREMVLIKLLLDGMWVFNLSYHDNIFILKLHWYDWIVLINFFWRVLINFVGIINTNIIQIDTRYFPI